MILNALFVSNARVAELTRELEELKNGGKRPARLKAAPPE